MSTYENPAPAYCPYCGTALPQGAVFCGGCGQPVGVAPAQQVAYETSGDGQEYVPADAAPQAPVVMDKKEFMKQSATFRKELLIDSIICYVGAGSTILINSIFLNPVFIVFGIILLGLALGMQLGKSQVCAILILVLSVIASGVAIALSGTPPYLWVAAGVGAVIAFNRVNKEYKRYLSALR